ncbi:MAG: class II aldolase/adducin family protein [Planctomycetes bacterium]|nr:class II aldolase/adducin family protein [Planctomycetota bacterium]
MEALIHKYARKLVEAGLAEEGAPLVGGLDAELVWNRPDPDSKLLAGAFDKLEINSLLYSIPKEPYRTIIAYLASVAEGRITPSDCETRTFLHDLPVVKEFTINRVISALKGRKSVIISGVSDPTSIITWGTVSPEQAFVSFSSVCFACFVKFFADYLHDQRQGRVTPEQKEVINQVIPYLDQYPQSAPELGKAPFGSEQEVLSAISEAGAMTVRHRLVDSYFGNISYRYGNILYISQTGSSLDEMDGMVDPVPLDGSSTAGITASSEFTAHREIVQTTGSNAVLHGHPKFAVIMSMDCGKQECPIRGECHLDCPEERNIADIPIVTGEVGTGPRGLCNTLPPAIRDKRGAIVHGHGVFTLGRDDFNEAFTNLLDIEEMCRREYFKKLKEGDARTPG